MRSVLITQLIVFLLVALPATASETPTQAAKPIWVDVRSWAENQWDGIDGDTHIPHRDIVQSIVTQFPDKRTPIKLYCARGVRAAAALQALTEAGYANVENAGGIDEVRKRRSIDAK